MLWGKLDYTAQQRICSYHGTKWRIHPDLSVLTWKCGKIDFSIMAFSMMACAFVHKQIAKRRETSPWKLLWTQLQDIVRVTWRSGLAHQIRHCARNFAHEGRSHRSQSEFGRSLRLATVLVFMGTDATSMWLLLMLFLSIHKRERSCNLPGIHAMWLYYRSPTSVSVINCTSH